MKFSERIGAREPPKSGLQEASTGLRTALWNLLHPSALPSDSTLWAQAHSNARGIWNHLGWRTDKVPSHTYDMRTELSDHWFRCEWPEFFDLVEFVARVVAPNHPSARRQWYDVANRMLELQGCAYRLIAEEFAPLTNPAEVAEVARASESAIPAVATHIREALRFLPPNSDVSPRNSIKESISAVEAAVKRLSGHQSATLTSGLSAFEGKYGDLHPALRAGLVKLYGYTSDEKGVRHALIDEAADVTVDDARFMVVICSAFANYLVALSSE